MSAELGSPTSAANVALNRALTAARRYRDAELELAISVKQARAVHIPILYLADALGVSRSRIRVLARGQQ